MKNNNIPYESKLAHITNIKERNKAFNALSNEDKRKEIAFDALNLLISEKVVAQAGIYWDNELRYLKDSTSTAEELQQTLCDLPTPEKGEYCGVCARGALMLSTIRLGNEISPNDDNLENGDQNNIKGFDFLDFLEMETEFEGTDYNDDDDPFYNLPYEAGTNEKLACILGNVIENGYYNMSDNTDYVEKWNLKV